MTLLSADRITKHKNPHRTISYILKASETIYQGSLVAIDGTTGKLESATNAANKIIVGVARESAVAAASGTTRIPVWTEGEFLFAKTTAAVTDIGKLAMVTDDQTVAPAFGTFTTALAGTNNDGLWTALQPFGGVYSDLISVTYLDPGAISMSLDSWVSGMGIVFSLATTTSAVISTTFDNIKTELAANALAAAMVSAADVSSNDGSGVVVATNFRLAAGPIVGTIVGFDSTTQVWIDIGRKIAAGL